MAKGGKREGAGRRKGSRNKATAAVKATLEELARGYTDVALTTLADICKGGESEAARVSAATALLDRGYGRPKQQLDHTGRVELSDIVQQLESADKRKG